MTRDDVHPPCLAVRLLELTAPEGDLECMLGDLQEEFALRRTRSAAAAWRWWGMGRLLFQVKGYDPLALLGSLVLLTFVALLAADGPARRASRTNLVSALGAD